MYVRLRYLVLDSRQALIYAKIRLITSEHLVPALAMKFLTHGHQWRFP